MRIPVRFRQLHRHAERAAARDDRHLVERVGFRHERRDHRVPRLVIRAGHALLLAHRHRLPLDAHQHLVARGVEVAGAHRGPAGAGGEQRRLVDQIREIGAGEAGRPARHGAHVEAGFERHLPRVHPQNLLAPADIGVADDDLAVEAPGPQERRVENVRPIRRRDDDDVFRPGEAVHLDEQLVERLLALLVAERAAAAVPADGVELVDEDDARAVTPRVAEEAPDARGADAGVHLDEIGSAGRDERHAGLARHRARQQRLAGAWRADEQDAARDAPADRREASGVLQEVDDLAHLVLGLVDARDVRKRHWNLFRVHRPRPLERRHASGHHAEQHQPRHRDEQQAERDRAVAAGVRRVRADDVEADAALGQTGHERRIGRHVALRRHRLDARAVAPLDEEPLGGDRHAGDAPRLHVGEELGKRHGHRAAGRARAQPDEYGHEQDDAQDGGACPDQAGARKLAFAHAGSPLGSQ